MKNDLFNIINQYSDVKIQEQFLARLREGNLSREENPSNHFCCYFLPYNLETKTVFMVAHKKSGLWLSPGGHSEKEEKPYDTAVREMREEIGAKNLLPAGSRPDLLTITYINDARPCKVHYDLWFFVQCKSSDLEINMEEFNETKWTTINDARKIVKDENNLSALSRIEKIFQKF